VRRRGLFSTFGLLRRTSISIFKPNRTFKIDNRRYGTFGNIPNFSYYVRSFRSGNYRTAITAFVWTFVKIRNVLILNGFFFANDLLNLREFDKLRV